MTASLVEPSSAVIVVIAHDGAGSVLSRALTETVTFTIWCAGGQITDGDALRLRIVGGVVSAGGGGGAGGVARKTAMTPLSTPAPAICPDALIARASVSVQPEPGASFVLRSTEPSVLVERNARLLPSAA